MIRKIEQSIAKIRGDFADGHLNDSDDWRVWRDALLFREEQGAIGDAMVQTSNGTKSILGYGVFSSSLFYETDNAQRQWFQVTLNFILDLNVNVQQYRRPDPSLFAKGAMALKAISLRITCQIRLLTIMSGRQEGRVKTQARKGKGRERMR